MQRRNQIMTYEEQYFTNRNKQKTKVMQEQKTTISLNIETPEADANSLYLIDWSKVTDINDLFIIIASLGVSFSPLHPSWTRIKHLMDYENPVPNPQMQGKPEKKEIKLPKLKSL